MGLAIALPLCSLVFWCSLSGSAAARGVRQTLRLEQPVYEQQHARYEIIVDGPPHPTVVTAQASVRALFVGHADPPGLYEGTFNLVDRALYRLATAATTPGLSASDERLRERAVALLERVTPSHRPRPRPNEFDWSSVEEVERLESMLAVDGVPPIVRYQSPLSYADAGRLTSGLGLLMLSLLALVVAPTFVIARQSNTLREDATSSSPSMSESTGPLVAIALVGLPLMVVALLGILTTAWLVKGLAALGILTSMTVGFVFMVQAAMHRTRWWALRTRATVAVGVSSAAWLAGVWVGVNGLERLPATLLPLAGYTYVVSDVLSGGGELARPVAIYLGFDASTPEVVLLSLAGALAWAVLGWLALAKGSLASRLVITTVVVSSLLSLALGAPCELGFAGMAIVASLLGARAWVN